MFCRMLKISQNFVMQTSCQVHGYRYLSREAWNLLKCLIESILRYITRYHEFRETIEFHVRLLFQFIISYNKFIMIADQGRACGEEHVIELG
jgi:hypothetical protein